MVAPLRCGFISGLPVSKFSLSCQTQASEEFQRTINGDVADFRVYFSNLRINLRKVLVSGRVEKGGDDLFPLLRRLQPFPRNARLKETFFQ